MGAARNWEPEVTHFRASVNWDGDDSDVTSLLGPSDNLHYNVNSHKHRAATLGTQRAEAPWESGSFRPSLWAAPAWCWVEPQ